MLINDVSRGSKWSVLKWDRSFWRWDSRDGLQNNLTAKKAAPVRLSFARNANYKLKASQKAIIRMANIAVPSYKSPFLCMLTLPKKFTGALLVYHLVMSMNNPGQVYDILYTMLLVPLILITTFVCLPELIQVTLKSVLLALMCMSCVFTGVKTNAFVKMRHKYSISLLQWRVIIKQRVLPRCQCYTFIGLSVLPNAAHSSTGGE